MASQHIQAKWATGGQETSFPDGDHTRSNFLSERKRNPGTRNHSRFYASPLNAVNIPTTGVICTDMQLFGGTENIDRQGLKVSPSISLCCFLPLSPLPFPSSLSLPYPSLFSPSPFLCSILISQVAPTWNPPAKAP